MRHTPCSCGEAHVALVFRTFSGGPSQTGPEGALAGSFHCLGREGHRVGYANEEVVT